MRVAFFLSGLGSGGIYNQTIGVIKLIKNLQLNNEDEICIITDEKKISIELDLGDIRIIYFKKTFLKKIDV